MVKRDGMPVELNASQHLAASIIQVSAVLAGHGKKVSPIVCLEIIEAVQENVYQLMKIRKERTALQEKAEGTAQ